MEPSLFREYYSRQGSVNQSRGSPQETDGDGEALSCMWGSCEQQYLGADALYEHLCNDHIGRKINNNLTLTCGWSDCGVTTVKRDHITSHVRIHIPFKPYKCSLCKKSFKRPQDLKKHDKIHSSGDRMINPVQQVNYPINQQQQQQRQHVVPQQQPLMQQQAFPGSHIQTLSSPGMVPLNSPYDGSSNIQANILYGSLYGPTYNAPPLVPVHRGFASPVSDPYVKAAGVAASSPSMPPMNDQSQWQNSVPLGCTPGYQNRKRALEMSFDLFNDVKRSRYGSNIAPIVDRLNELSPLLLDSPESISEFDQSVTLQTEDLLETDDFLARLSSQVSSSLFGYTPRQQSSQTDPSQPIFDMLSPADSAHSDTDPKPAYPFLADSSPAGHAELGPRFDGLGGQRMTVGLQQSARPDGEVAVVTPTTLISTQQTAAAQAMEQEKHSTKALEVIAVLRSIISKALTAKVASLKQSQPSQQLESVPGKLPVLHPPLRGTSAVQYPQL